MWTFDRLDKLGAHATKVFGSPRVIDSTEGKAVEFDGVDDALFVNVHPLAGAEMFTWEVIFRPYKGRTAVLPFAVNRSRDKGRYSHAPASGNAPDR